MKQKIQFGFCVFGAFLLQGCSAALWAPLSNSLDVNLNVTGPTVTQIQNDSEGAMAQFWWESPGTNEVRVAYGSQKSELDSWVGQSQISFTDGALIQDMSQCHSSYRTAASGALSSNDHCGVSLASLPAWTKRWFRIAIIDPATRGVTLSSTFGVGHVPPGMVLIAREEWPSIHYASTDAYDGYPRSYGREGGATTGPFDFAIDKYQSVLVGDLVTCTFGGCWSAYPNDEMASTTYFKSFADGVTPPTSTCNGCAPAGHKYSWYIAKQGCLNRTWAAEYSAWALSTFPATDRGIAFHNKFPERAFHLMTGLERTVAVTGLPVGSIDYDTTGTVCAGTTPPTPGWNPNDPKRKCISRYGVRNMHGGTTQANMDDEFADGYSPGDIIGAGIIWQTFFGTFAPATTSLTSVSESTTTGDYISVFNYLLGISAGESFTAPAEFKGAIFARWSMVQPRHLVYYGPYSHAMDHLPLGWSDNDARTRCAIVAP